MAREVIEKLTDDLDGSEADHTVLIGWEGEWREIDLSQRNIDALAEVFDRYWEAGRQHQNGGGSPRGRRRQSVQQQRRGERDFDIVQLREWAGRNGVAVPQRGRIPAAVVAQYKAAGGR